MRLSASIYNDNHDHLALLKKDQGELCTVFSEVNSYLRESPGKCAPAVRARAISRSKNREQRALFSARLS